MKNLLSKSNEYTRGQLTKKRQQRSYVELQKRLQTLFQDFVAERKSLAEFLCNTGDFYDISVICDM